MTNKQKQRIERKKKKICAFLTIARMNDQDRTEKLKAENASEINDVSDESNLSVNPMAGDGPCRKRIRKESDDQVRGETVEQVPESNQNLSVSIQKINLSLFELNVIIFFPGNVTAIWN